MKIGFDTYSYHRWFGDVRLDESAVTGGQPRGTLDLVDLAHRLRADAISLQTCFLPPTGEVDVEQLRGALGAIEPVIAWGHPDGLAFGGSASAAADVRRWIELAPALGSTLVRIVAGNSGTDRLGKSLEHLADVLLPILELAREHGVLLALENHADLTVTELERLLELVDDATLGVCLDTANTLRVGDESLDATRRLLPHLRMVHLKDVEGGEFEPASGPRSVVYGEGVVPVREIVETLDAAGFIGPIVVELGYLGGGPVDEDALLTACIDWLLNALEGGRSGRR
jgi:hypothetical protein